MIHKSRPFPIINYLSDEYKEVSNHVFYLQGEYINFYSRLVCMQFERLYILFCSIGVFLDNLPIVYSIICGSDAFVNTVSFFFITVYSIFFMGGGV